MSEQFYTILTKQGKAKIANATALGHKVNLSKFQVGDGGGSYYNPSEDQIKLRNKVWEGNISSITVDKSNPNWIVLEVIIPHDVGGFMIREAGVFDDSGNLMAIGKYPETYKPVVADGSTKDLIIKMILEVSNTSSVTLKIDPSITIATKEDIKKVEKQIGNIKIPVQSVNGKTGAIELKAEDIKTKDGTNLEEFKKKTTSQYEDLVNNHKHLGINLLSNSNFINPNVIVEHTGKATYEVGTPRYGTAIYGKNVLGIHHASSGDYDDCYCWTNLKAKVEAGKTYVISYYYMCGGIKEKVSASNFILDNKKNIYSIETNLKDNRYNVDQKWHRYLQSFKCPEGVDEITFRFGLSTRLDAWLQIDCIKVEEGTIATDWTPALEDYNYLVDVQSKRLDSIEKILIEKGFMTAKQSLTK